MYITHTVSLCIMFDRHGIHCIYTVCIYPNWLGLSLGKMSLFKSTPNHLRQTGSLGVYPWNPSKVTSNYSLYGDLSQCRAPSSWPVALQELSNTFWGFASNDFHHEALACPDESWSTFGISSEDGQWQLHIVTFRNCRNYRFTIEQAIDL